MSSKDLKLKIKEARELVKNKELSGAINKCREILKTDSGNYMALVLLGACYQDSNKEEATKYLKKAVDSTTDDPSLALLGLITCAPEKELPIIFLKLLKLRPEKCEENHQKLLNACFNVSNISHIVNALYEETKNHDPVSNINTLRVKLAWSSLVQILIEHAEMAEEKYLDIFEEALLFTVSNKGIPKHQERCHRLICILYKKKKFEDLLKMAIKFNEIYLHDNFFLEWFCKIYIEVPDLTESHMISKSIDTYINQLLHTQSLSASALMAQAVYFFRGGMIQRARDIILKVYQIKPKWSKCVILLYDIYVRSGAFIAAEDLFNQSTEFIPMDTRIVKCLVQQKDMEKSKKAIQISKELLANMISNETNVEIIILMARAFLNSEDLARVDKTIQKLKSLNCNPDIITTLNFLKLFQDEKSYDEAADFLPENMHLTDAMLLLDVGVRFVQLKDIHKAISYFLKSAKIENCNSEIFYWLGKAYNQLDDQERCIKCLEKCIQLNFEHSNAVKLLSAIYRKQKKWDCNILLLEKAIKHTHTSSGKWAYFQLGLHHLAKGHYDNSVNAFRSALRFKDPTIMFYVGLGDAFFARGSLKSALNVYKKALELNIEKNADHTYVLLQVSSINRILENFEDALKGFTDILRKDYRYIPALMGIAETHYHLATFLAKQQRHARARQNAQKSVDYLTILLKHKSNLACTWRLYACILDFTYKLSVQHRFLEVLLESNSSLIMVRDDTLLQLTTMFLSKAIKQCNDDHVLWRQLSKSYLSRAVINFNTINIKEKRKLLILAKQSAKQAIKLEPKSWENWNLLGIISVIQPEKDLSFSQHCFIQALNIEKRSGVTWSNLAFLYLSQSNIKLANHAFGRSQQINEKFMNAWIGQGLVAEYIGDNDEAIDLFRHSTELGFDKHSAFGYTNLICSILDESSRSKNILLKYWYFIYNMNAVVLAMDQIYWYQSYMYERTNLKANVHSLCFLAYLCIQKGLYYKAIQAYTVALRLPNIEITQRDKILCDLAFVYIKVKEFSMAIQTFKSISETDLKSTIGLALAYSKAQDFDSSYSTYSSALDSYISNDLQKSSILTAMSAILYMYQGERDAKTLLFQSLSENNLHTFLSACSLGLLHGDVQLAKLAMDQMKKNENDPRFGHHIVFLNTQYLLLTHNIKKAIQYVSSMVHSFPDRSEIRNIFSNLLIHYSKSTDMVSVARLALSTNLLIFSSNNSINDAAVAAKLCAVASKSILKIKPRKAKILAQKAIFLYPACKEAWTAFVSSQILND